METGKAVRFREWVPLILILAFMCSLIFELNASAIDSPSIQTPQSAPQLFERNPCAAPCWFDITPGLSTIEETVIALETYFPEEPAIRVHVSTTDDSFEFIEFVGMTFDPEDIDEWRNRNIEPSFIHFRNSIVSRIQIAYRSTMSLEQVINLLGQPDYAFAHDWGFAIDVDLWYADAQTLVTFSNIFSHQGSGNSNCEVQNPSTDLSLTTITYFDLYRDESRDDVIRDYNRYFSFARLVSSGSWDDSQLVEEGECWSDTMSDLPLLETTPEEFFLSFRLFPQAADG